MSPLKLLSEFLLDFNTPVIFDRESPAKVSFRIEESIYTEMKLPAIICFQMYLFIDHFEIKNKSLNKQVFRRVSGCSMVLRCDSYFLWFSGISCDPPGVSRCSVSAPSAIGCSVTPGPPVSVLLDAV